MGVKVTLACTECKQRNYNTMKNDRLIQNVWNLESTASSVDAHLHRDQIKPVAGKTWIT